jgi:magnesium transporter
LVFVGVTISAYLYDAEGRDREVELNEETLRALGEGRLLWIDLNGRNREELGQAARELKLDPASLRNLMKGENSQLENYGAYTQFAVETAPATVSGDAGKNQANGSLHGGTRVDFVVANGWLLTVHDEVPAFIEAFRSQDKAETTIGTLTSHDFAGSILDAHLEAYFDEIARIESMVDRLDEQALTRPSSASLLGRMVALRRRVSRLRTVLSQQRGVFYGLSRPDLQIVSESGASPHFQVLVGRFERAIDEVEHARDLVVGSFELFATRTAQQTNDLVKALTFLTAVIGLCAAVAGVFGMNFETGFFEAGDTGFYVTIITLGLIILLSTAVARWRGWI